jgi:hypothetical protein
MNDELREHTLRLRSKISLFIMFALIGVPMLYTSYLNFQAQEVLFGSLMAGLFLAWSLVILFVLAFRIKVTDSEILREGLFSVTAINFADVDTIHFGSTWSDFHLQANDSKLFISKDFIDHESIIQAVISKIRDTNDLDDIDFTGQSKDIEKYVPSTNPQDQ